MRIGLNGGSIEHTMTSGLAVDLEGPSIVAHLAIEGSSTERPAAWKRWAGMLQPEPGR